MSSKNYHLYYLAICFIVFLFLPTKILASDDLTFNWGKDIGGSGSDHAQIISKDPGGNFYLLGDFSSTVDFDPSETVENHTSAGGTDTFLSKYDSNWNYLWTKTWGSNSLYEAPYSMDWDPQGNMYIYGEFGNTVDFDTDPLVTSYATSSGSTDLYLTKYNSDGSYGWTKTWGSSSAEHAGDVEFDNLGNMYVVGEFQKTVDFNTSLSATDNATSSGSLDVFLTKYDTDGNYAWTKTFGGTSYDYAIQIDFDSDNNVYITGGFTKTVDFDPSVEGTDNHTANNVLYSNVYDCYLTKYNSDGTYGWTKTWGGAGEDYMNGIAIDSNDNIYISGLLGAWTNSSNLVYDLDPGPGEDNHTINDPGSDYYNDAVFMKFDTDGNYKWGKTWGGTGDDWAFPIAFDSNNNVYVGTAFSGTVDLDPNLGINNFTSVGDVDVALSKFDADGNYYWSETWGSTGYDVIPDIKTYSDTLYLNFTVGGSVDYDPGNNVSTSTFAGGSDVVAISMSINNPTSVVANSSSSSSSGPESIQIPEMSTDLGGPVIVSPIKDSDTGGQGVMVIIFPGIFNFNAYLSTYNVNPNNIVLNFLKNVSKSPKSGGTLYAGGGDFTILGIKRDGVVFWQIGKIQEMWLKAYPASGYSAPKIIPELQEKNSIIVLKYKDNDLIPPGFPKTKFNEIKLKIAHSLDENTWTILGNSVVDPVTNTVATIGKVGGYYMIVGGY